MRMRAGPEDDDEHRREDAADEREEHLDRRLGCHLLRALAALDAQLLGLDLEDARDRDAELLGLDDRADEARERGHLHARDHLAQGVAPGLADADLRERAPELVGERPVRLLDDLAERGVEAEAGLDRDRQQVERVRDRQEDRLLALPDPPREPVVRHEEAEDQAAEHRG